MLLFECHVVLNRSYPLLRLTKYLLVFFCFISVSSQAGVITKPWTAPISNTQYISLAGYDWVWASSINIQFYACQPTNVDGSDFNFDAYTSTVYQPTTLAQKSACNPYLSNQLMGPSYNQENWFFYEDLFNSQISVSEYLSNLATIQGKSLQDLFLDSGGNPIEAFNFWNTSASIIGGMNNPFTSDWRVDPRFVGFMGSYKPINTIYVRKSKTQSQPVPEPSTLFIFAIGLFALAFRLKRNTTL